MRIFGSLNDDAIYNDVCRATSEQNLNEDWTLIMAICDKAGKSREDAKTYIRSIIKRLNNSDPHIGVKAVTLLDACVNNSGKHFLVEIASREFESDFVRLMTKSHPTVAKMLRESLRKWAENEFKLDPQLSIIPSLYAKLKSSGLDFTVTEAPVKKLAPFSNDPNVVESQEEEEQIFKAMELSLKEPSSLYPSISAAGTFVPSSIATSNKEPRKVKALYDFEAAEDNELTFFSGEILLVTDDSDTNWWKGSNHRGEGLFPANFVTADLSIDPVKLLNEKPKKTTLFKDTVDVKEFSEESEHADINEEKIDRLLYLLHESDPTSVENDSEEIVALEAEVLSMEPAIDIELEKVDRKHAQLTQLSAGLVEALSLYHSLMRGPEFSPVHKMTYNFPPVSSSLVYNGTSPPSIAMPMMQFNQERPAFIPSVGQPQRILHMPPSSSNQMASAQRIPQMPPNVYQQMTENRRVERPTVHHPERGMPDFRSSRLSSQTNIQNGPTQQGPPSQSSSNHNGTL